jgi:hypothetical protein
MRRTIMLTIATLLAACPLADELEGEPCAVDEDCWVAQECTRTPQEEALQLDGLCLPKKRDCEQGMQLGCACDPNDYTADCSRFVTPDREGYPEMVCDPMVLQCVALPADTATETTMTTTEGSTT